jgi:hypothetical protein
VVQHVLRDIQFMIDLSPESRLSTTQPITITPESLKQDVRNCWATARLTCSKYTPRDKAGQTMDQARDQQAGPRTQSGRVTATLESLWPPVLSPGQIVGGEPSDIGRLWQRHLSALSVASIISICNSTKMIWTSTSPDEGSNDGRHWCERRRRL